MITLFCELSGFFNKDTELAVNIINKIKEEANRDKRIKLVVKSEIMHTTDICIDKTYTDSYVLSDGTIKSENYIEMLSRKVLSFEDYEYIFEHASSNNLDLALSVYTVEGIAFAEKIKAKYLKIASSNFLNVPLYECVFRSDVGIIIVDTGRLPIDQIEKEWKEYQKLANRFNKEVIIEHSQDGHPSLPKDNHLSMIEYFKKLSPNVGLSDHDATLDSIPLAIAMGAKYIERGIRPEGNASDIDETFASEINSLGLLIDKISKTLDKIGNIRTRQSSYSSHVASPQHSCLILNKDIEKGEILRYCDFKTGFPCLGISVSRSKDIIGKTAKRALKNNHILNEEDF